MSGTVFFISLIFALLEAGLSWLVLAFEPVASLFTGAPLWVVTGTIFGIGMLLTFVVIIIVGSMNITDRAASFVRDHFGRTVLLALFSILAVLVVSIGGEMLYQATPIPKHQKKGASADICFVLDYSISMDVGDRETAMKEAFAQAVSSMSSDQRINVVKYTSDASVLYDWTPLTDAARDEVTNIVRSEEVRGGTDFNDAIRVAGQQVEKLLPEGRSVAIVMISDGEDPSFSGVANVAPVILDNNVQIHTIWVGDSDEGNLREISDETGGSYLVSGADVAGLSQTLVEVTRQASSAGVEEDTVPDTLLTERWVSRQTIINARVLRILILFLLGFWFKIIAIICIGNNDSSAFTHVLHAFLVAVLAALFVEFGYGFGIPLIAILAGFWVLMITQIVRTDR